MLTGVLPQEVDKLVETGFPLQQAVDVVHNKNDFTVEIF